MPESHYDAHTGTWIAPPTYAPRQDPVARAYYDRVHRLTRAINARLGHSHPETEGGLLDAVDALLATLPPDTHSTRTANPST